VAGDGVRRKRKKGSAVKAGAAATVARKPRAAQLDVLAALVVPDVVTRKARSQEAALPTAARQVHARLRADIVAGTLRPGERLRINELTTRYNSGAIPLREALNRLTGEDLVVHSEQRGFAVAPISLEGLKDLTRARSMISEIAMREAVKNGDAAWEERVVVAYHRVSKVPRYNSTEPPVPNPEYDRLHREFHSTLLSGCNSRLLVQVSEALFDHAERYLNLSRKVAVVAREDEHAQIMRAALDRKVDEAVDLIKRHVQLTCEIVLAHAARIADS